MREELVTYTLNIDGQFVVVEHVSARVDPETGERFFAPETVERLQQLVWRQPAPVRVIQTPGFEFTAELV